MRRSFVRLFLLTILVCHGIAAYNADLPAVETDVRIWVGRDVAPGPSIRLSINTRNVAVIRLAAYRVDMKPYLVDRESLDTNDSESHAATRPAILPPGHPVRVWSVSTDDPKSKANPQQDDIYRSRQINLEPLPPGGYLLVASGGGKSAWAVVNITNLAIVIKRAPRSVLCWVTDHRTIAPVSGASVELWDRKLHRLVTRGTTTADGTVVMNAAPNADETLIVERRNGTGREVAGLAVGNEDPDGKLVAHLQTDRPVYRPGARVEFKAILRRTSGRGYLPEANVPYTVEVRDGRDNVIQKTKETTNAVGTLADSVDISAHASLGAYSIILTAVKDGQSDYQTFTVAEYRKPEFAVTVAPAKPRYLAGEPVVFTVKAAYYFGAPLPGAHVQYQIRRNPNPFYGGLFGSEDERAEWFSGGDGNLYDRDTYASQPFVGEGTVETDALGNASIPVKTQKDLPDMTYSVTCTVIDGQRRQVEAGGGVPVYAALIRIGIRTTVLCTPIGGVVPVDLRLADLDGKPVAGRVTLMTQRLVFRTKPDEWIPETLSKTTIVVGASGKARGTVPALAAGNVSIVAGVKDATGRAARATTYVYVAGPTTQEYATPEQPKISVRLDRRTYQVGDAVHVYMTTNVTTAPVLLTVEGGDVFDHVVIPAGRRTFTWTAKASLPMSPNAYVTASQWAPGVHFVSDSAILPVPDLSRRLSITVEPNQKSYRPGDQAAFTVRVNDGATGKPVGGAEAAVAVVDEAIFAVRPDTTADPYTLYWGTRANKTDTRSSAPEEVSGGAYQRNNPNGVAAVRERFLDTAYWNARTVTGPDGTATVLVDMPGNLTSWRATAIAITDGTQVGRATANVAVSRPVMLRLSTPRQFVQGDELKLIGTINNRTDRARTCAATLAADGVALADGETATKTITVPAGGEGKVQWSVRAATIPDNDAMAAKIEGTLVTRNLAPGEVLSDYSDHLRVTVPVRPRGVAERLAVGGTIADGSARAVLNIALPTDRIEPATTVTVTVEGGVMPEARQAARDVLAATDWGLGTSAEQLLIAATPNAPTPDRSMLRDTLAGIERDQHAEGGWGDWQGAPVEPGITARVLSALTVLRDHASRLPWYLPFPDKMFARGIEGAQARYNDTGLWEDRARLAVALAAADKSKVGLLSEVARRSGDGLSPDATLLLADGFQNAGMADEAREQLEKVQPYVIAGPDSARVPAGDHPGWKASPVETTSQMLLTLIAMRQQESLQSKLARYLASPGDGGYRTVEGEAAIARALLAYVESRGVTSEPLRDGDVSLTVNGTSVRFAQRAPGMENDSPLTTQVPRALLIGGSNEIVLKRLGRRYGDWFVRAQATVYRPRTEETGSDLRVLRRFETQTPFGTWQELKADSPLVRPGVPVRVTVVVWPNDQADAVQVTEPLPTGFEFVDSELPSGAYGEVRDGALIHLVHASGSTPLTFRYYMRAESEGSVADLPATGALLLRPDVIGSSSLQNLQIEEAAKK